VKIPHLGGLHHIMNAFQPNVMPEDGFGERHRRARAAPGDRARANAPLNRPFRGRRASAGGQWAVVGVCKTRIERVGHSREWVASGCAVRRTWRSGIIGYHYESRPIQRLLLMEPPGASTVGTATMIVASDWHAGLKK
jgi:hypothetical protein